MRVPGLRAALLAALLPLLAACRPPDTLRLGWGATFRLRPPETGPALFETQAVEVTLPEGRTERMLTTVENGPRRLAVVASTPLGLTVFTATLEAGRATADLRVPLPPAADPRLLLALVQLSRWPADEVRRGLGPGLDLREEGPLRTLVRKGAEVARIRQTPDGLDLDLPTAGIRIRVTRLEEAP